MRPLLAFVMSPLPIVALLPIFGVRLIGNQSILAVLAFFYVAILFCQTVVAVPARVILRRWNMHSLWIDIGLGAAGGVLPTLIYELMRSPRPNDALIEGATVGAGVIGAIVGPTYGLLRWRDRKARRRVTPAELAARFD